MPEIDVTFELVTPAYAGGADTKYTDGLRPPTLKALLRFWWRTMHPELLPKDLFKAEERIFGSTRVGQGLRVIPLQGIAPNNVEQNAPRYTFKQQVPLFYMVYGADTHKEGNQRLQRPRVRAGAKYLFRLIAGRNQTGSEWSQVLNAVWLLSVFGGLGSRSRRGFGSLQIIGVVNSLPDLMSCNDTQEVRESIQTALSMLFAQRHGGVPEHTAFSDLSRIVVGPPVDTWEAALIAAGKVFHQLRRYYGTTYDHTARRKPVGPDFRKVTNYRITRPSPPNNTSTLGAAFGLPQNYQFSSGWKPSLEVFTPKDIAKISRSSGSDSPTQATSSHDIHGSGRRASPVFFRVLKIANQRYVPLVAWLPARFLGAGYEVRFNDGGTWTLQDPRNTGIEPLFQPSRIVNGTIGSTSRPLTFTGYPGQTGWEVIW